MVLKMAKLTRSFFARDTRIVARDLLGKVLVHKTSKGMMKGIIVETEAYLGKNDPGSIGLRRVKNIPAALLEPPGHAFIYFTYGNHWMFNINAKKGRLGSVLIRAVEPITTVKRKTGVKITNGPGKLTRAFRIDKKYDGRDITRGNLFIENSFMKPKIITSTRIGLSDGKEKRLRYYIKENKYVSR